MVRLYQLPPLVHGKVHLGYRAARQMTQKSNLFASERDTEFYLVRADIFG